MAKAPTTIKQVIARIMKKEVGDRENLRKILKGLEINVLSLKSKEVDNIHLIIQNELNLNIEDRLLTTKTDKSTNSQLDLLEGEILGAEGDVELEKAKWAHIDKYKKLANKDLAGDNIYDLGHSEASIFILYMQLLKKYYPLGHGEEGSRQLELINNTIAIANKIDRLTSSEISKLKANQKGKGVSDAELITIVELAGKEQVIDVSASSTLINDIHMGMGEIKIELETRGSNRFKGDLTRLLGTKFSKFFGNKFADKGAGFESKLIESLDPVLLKFSPSFEDRIGQVVDAAFFKKKIPKRIQKSKVQITRKIPKQNSTALALKKRLKDRIRNLKSLALARKLKKRFIIPTVTLKALINESLKEFIQARMQVSTAAASTNYLRNQTGRFSESARLLTLNRDQRGAYFGVYTFMHDPYDVFSRGGGLHSPGRDPNLYIEGSIRQIAFNVLKDKFVGIALESK